MRFPEYVLPNPKMQSLECWQALEDGHMGGTMVQHDGCPPQFSADGDKKEEYCLYCGKELIYPTGASW